MAQSSERSDVVHKIIDSIIQMMYEQSWNTMISICSSAGFAHMIRLYDNQANTTDGYWFYNDTDNLFKFTGEKERTGMNDMKRRGDTVEQWLFQGLITQAALADNQARKRYYKDQIRLFITPALDSDHHIKPTPEQEKAYLTKLEDLETIENYLVGLIALTTPGPPLPLSQLRYANTKDQTRNIFIKNNVVTIVQDDDKLERPLPWVVGELIIRYLVVFRPLQMLLASKFPSKYENERKRMATYLFAHERTWVDTITDCNALLNMYGGDVNFGLWLNLYIDQNAEKFDRKYQRWNSGERQPSNEEIEQIQQRFELNSGLHLIGVRICVNKLGRSTILPFTSIR